jgi:putative holliday junction resolvase
MENLDRGERNVRAARPAGRILALDVGKKRIGLAVSDELGITAQGLETFERTRIRDDLDKLKEIAKQLRITCLLIGEPLHMSGSESRQSAYTREFAERLACHLDLRVVFWDERLTSIEAERVLRGAGASPESQKRAVDRLAATLLLESYLARQSKQGCAEERDALG